MSERRWRGEYHTLRAGTGGRGLPGGAFGQGRGSGRGGPVTLPPPVPRGVGGRHGARGGAGHRKAGVIQLNP